METKLLILRHDLNELIVSFKNSSKSLIGPFKDTLGVLRVLESALVFRAISLEGARSDGMLSTLKFGTGHNFPFLKKHGICKTGPK